MGGEGKFPRVTEAERVKANLQELTCLIDERRKQLELALSRLSSTGFEHSVLLGLLEGELAVRRYLVRLEEGVGVLGETLSRHERLLRSHEERLARLERADLSRYE